MLKIRICTPFYSEFEDVKSGVRECLNYDKIKFAFEPRQSGPLIYKVRNSFLNDSRSQLKKQVPLEEFSHFLFADSDITFTLKHVLSLLEKNIPIACSPYLTHNDDGFYHTGMFEKEIPGLIKKQFMKYERGFKEVDYSGTGFMLIERKVLEIMEYPWFEPLKIDNGDKAEIIGEDVVFCMKSKQLGFPVYCDFNNAVKHRLRKQNDFNWDINKNEL